MIIILEGPDFAGKSTIAEATGHRIIHNGPVPAGYEAFAYYTDQLLNLDPREDVVFDRAWVGELIYGPIFRGKSNLTYGQHLELTQLALTLGATLIFVDVPDAVLRDRFHGVRGDEMIKEEDTLMRISAQYRRLIGEDYNWESVGALA